MFKIIYLFLCFFTIAEQTEIIRIERVWLSPTQINLPSNHTLHVSLNIAEEHKIYLDTIQIVSSLEGIQIGKVNSPQAIMQYDKFSKKNRYMIESKADLEAPIELTQLPENLKIPAILKYQACTKKYCLLPKEMNFQIDLTGYFSAATSNQWAFKSDSSSKSFCLLDLAYWQEKLSEKIKNIHQLPIWMALLGFFVLGMLTSFTPCVYPVIPITLRTFQNLSKSEWPFWVLGYSYIFGLSLTYAALGLFAGLTGKLFGSWLQTPLATGVLGIILIFLAFGSFGLFNIHVHLPVGSKAMQTKAHPLYQTWIMGLLSGLIAGPCLGPVLLGILGYLAYSQDWLLGALGLLAFAFGKGHVLLGYAVLSRLLHKIPKSGPWMQLFNFVLGLLLLALGYNYLGMALPKSWFAGLVGLVSLTLLVWFWYHRKKEPFVADHFSIIVAFILGLGWINARGGFALHKNHSLLNQYWQPFSEEYFQHALTSQKPILLDFYADWCASCHELEEKVFSNEKFIQETQDMILIRFDATHDSPMLQKFTKEYKIMGLPTVLAFDRMGRYRAEYSFLGEITLSEALQKIQALKQEPFRLDPNDATKSDRQ